MADKKVYPMSDVDRVNALRVLGDFDKDVQDNRKSVGLIAGKIEDKTPNETKEQRQDRYFNNIQTCFSEYLSRPKDGVFFLPEIFRIDLGNPRFRNSCYEDAAVSTISDDDSISRLILEGILEENFPGVPQGGTVPPRVVLPKK